MLEVSAAVVKVVLWLNMDIVMLPDISADSWHRLCIDWYSITGSLQLYVDDILRKTESGYGQGRHVSRSVNCFAF